MTRVLLVFPLFLAGCDAINGFRQRLAIDRADVAATPAVQLAVVRRAGERNSGAAMRVVVGADGAAIDNAALLRHYGVGRDPVLLEVDLENLLVVESGLSLAASEESGYFIEAVYAAAQRGVDATRQIARWTGRAGGGDTAELWIDRAVTYGTVTRVLYTLGQVGISEFEFVVGGGAIPIASAVHCDRRESGLCLAPDVWVTTDGVMVAARETTRDGCLLPLLGTFGDGTGLGDLLGSEGVGLKGLGISKAKARTPEPKPREPKPREPKPSEPKPAFGPPPAFEPSAFEPPPASEPQSGARPLPEWAGRIVLRADGACPSVPHVGGRVDVAGLETFLATLQAVAPGCRRNTVSAAEEVRWADVAAVLAVVVVERGLDRAVLSADFGGAPSCEGSVRIDQVE